MINLRKFERITPYLFVIAIFVVFANLRDVYGWCNLCGNIEKFD
jgi:hypothetical protein